LARPGGRGQAIIVLGLLLLLVSFVLGKAG
jgi:hypothetical protein